MLNWLMKLVFGPHPGRNIIPAMSSNVIDPIRPRSFLRRSVRTLAAFLAIAYFGIGAFFYLKQDAMTFPAPAHFETHTPAEAGILFEDLHIPVNPKDQIHAWYIPAASTSDKVLLYFHGNGYCLEQTVGTMGEVVALHDIGVNLLMADYRGYGTSSPGQAREKSVYQDARAALNYLTQKRQMPIHDIVFVGRSIGTGVATEIAKEHPEAGGLVLISPFTSTIDVAKASMWYLNVFPLFFLSHNQFNNLSKIDAVHVPVLILVGDHDTLTPPSMAQSLLSKANPPKRLQIITGPDHNQMFQVGQQELVQQMTTFVQTLH
jgi:uncharacterized protein